MLNGIGVGLALSTLNSAAAKALPSERFGVGTAIDNSFRRLGALHGVSLFVAVLGTPTSATILGDYHRVWWVLAVIPVISARTYLATHREPEAAG